MIAIRLAGGLGNQIFQLGAALLLAERSNQHDILIDTSSLYNYTTGRDYSLDKIFDLTKTAFEIKSHDFTLSKLRLPKLFPLMFEWWPLVGDSNFSTVSKSRLSKARLLDGYFQWVLTQSDFSDMRRLLSPMLRENLRVENTNGCILHIRGGDFVKLGWDAVTPPSYYTKAVEHMVAHGEDNFWVVTDDPNYAKDILVNIKYKIISGDIVDDFFKILSHKRKIISSSTFSFWASALNHDPKQCVIAPGFWWPGKERLIYIDGEHRL
ncbi:alpha-1,2-fucosyltransferase [Aeromonas enteropelogenes]|uniref:alpha-1,2-fucosyltransferase n=1 Tax=Aeromonas enteropelogenes TaxID=29489 RepID=UPI003F79C87A